jgi:GAF domain-containing protein
VPLWSRRGLQISATPDSTRPNPEQQIADLERQLAEAREQHTVTINSSQGNLKPVFEAILERAVRLRETACGQLATYDGAFFRFVAAHGDAVFVREQLARSPMAPSSGVTWPLQVKGENTVHIADMKDTEVYRSGYECARRFVDIGGGRTLLSIALRKEKALLGAITVYRRQVRQSSEKQIALLEGFGDQAVIAMENARLMNETREALEQPTLRPRRACRA